MHFFHPRWPVFYEDNHLLVIYKPAGLIMQRGKQDKKNLVDLARQWIKTRYKKPGDVFVGMIHRLDAPVAGVLVLARTSKAASRLSAQFRESRIRKTYLAVVQGAPDKDKGRLVHRLVRKGRYSHIDALDNSESREARLRYQLIETREDKSLIEIHLETGRRHQIRVQLASMGCPIIGDVAYGAEKHMADGRIALLAHKLAFEHPTRKEPMQFSTPLPEGWPWPSGFCDENRPLWTIEELYADGLT